ncbi:MAG: hypothetical protein KGM15_11275 [Pseudomonadota bacterium]|nr:hypothetical protein [Pseudomonadota bacterium]
MKFPGLGFAALSLLALVSLSAPAGAQASHEYEIAANDGYGLEDCLAGGAECGHVVADAWCEAHGHGHALAFGLRSAMTGQATNVSTAEEPYVVNCAD